MISHFKQFLFSLCFFAAAVAIPQPAFATHFRYGQISWTTANLSSNTVQFQFYAAFRRSGYSGSAPDGYPAIGNVISEDIGDTTFYFGDGHQTPELQFYVLNIDATNDWLYGVALNPGSTNPNVPFTHVYSTSGPWTAYIDSCCRISTLVNAADGEYRVQTTIDLTKTTNSPSSTLPIIVQCPANQLCQFSVPATDSQNQLLTYRLANSTESYLGQPSGFDVSSSGVATFPAPNTPGALYAAQIEVEKRDRTNTSKLLTTIGVDFLIQVVNMPTGQPPSFQSPTPTCGQQITLQVGQPISFEVSARSNNNGGTVSLNVIGQPAGSTFTPALPTSGSPSVSSTFNFTPSASQTGTFQMNFTATDQGLQTACGYSIVVPQPNTVVSLSGIRATGGNQVRLQLKIANTECSTPIFKWYSRVGSGTSTLIATTSVPLIQTTLTGPAGTQTVYYAVMSFANNCATPALSNNVSFTY